MTNGDKYAIGLLIGLVFGSLMASLNEDNAGSIVGLAIIGAACGTRLAIQQQGR